MHAPMLWDQNDTDRYLGCLMLSCLYGSYARLGSARDEDQIIYVDSQAVQH